MYAGPNAEAIAVALLTAGADVNAVAEIGDSALCMTSDLAVMRVLLVAGADPHQDGGHNGTASFVDIALGADNANDLSLLLELGLDINHRGPFKRPPQFHEPRLPFDAASLLHRAAHSLGAAAVELLLSAGAREDTPALKNINAENAPEIATLPIDVVGAGVHQVMTPELQRRADAIRSMLTGAHLYRKGWLSVLRSRFDAGESLTGIDGGGQHSCCGGGSGVVEGPPPRRQRGERLGSSCSDHVGVPAVEGEAWYGAAVWIARVPGPEVFRMITECL